MSGQQTNMPFLHSVPVAGKKLAARPKVTTRVKHRGLQVTEADIAGAIRENSHSCMIAEAIKRQVPGAKRVSVDVQSIRYTDTIKGRRVSCLTPPACQFGLVQFDQGVPVTPFSFDLQSIQVTAVTVCEPKRDANGDVVKRVARHRRRDGTVAEYETALTVAVSGPDGRREFTPGVTPSRDHIVGGRMPPKHMPSFKRKYGMKGFTWKDAEDEAAEARVRAAMEADYTPADEVVNIPADEAVKMPSDEAVNPPADEAVNLPADEAVNIPSDEAVNIPADEAVNDPADVVLWDPAAPRPWAEVRADMRAASAARMREILGDDWDQDHDETA